MNVRVSKLVMVCVMMMAIACASVKKPEQTGVQSITFGSGGGFTGQVKSYRLDADGKLFENDQQKKQIGEKETFELFSKASQLKEYKFSEPGNMSSFVEIKSTESNRIVWPYGSEKVDSKVTSLHKALMAITE